MELFRNACKVCRTCVAADDLPKEDLACFMLNRRFVSPYGLKISRDDILYGLKCV